MTQLYKLKQEKIIYKFRSILTYLYWKGSTPVQNRVPVHVGLPPRHHRLNWRQSKDEKYIKKSWNDNKTSQKESPYDGKKVRHALNIFKQWKTNSKFWTTM